MIIWLIPVFKHIRDRFFRMYGIAQVQDIRTILLDIFSGEGDTAPESQQFQQLDCKSRIEFKKSLRTRLQNSEKLVLIILENAEVR